MKRFEVLGITLIGTGIFVVGLWALSPSREEDVNLHKFTVSSGQAPTFITLEDYLRTARSHYLATDSEIDRSVIRSVVLQEVAGWDLNEVKDSSLTAWVIDLKKSSGEKQ